MRRRHYLALAGLATTGTLAGCSGDDSDENGSDEEPDGDDTGNESTDNGGNGDQAGGDENGDDDTDSENGDDEPESAAFEVTSIETPETATVDEEYTVSVTVENTGGQTGTFEQALENKVESDESWMVSETITVEEFGPGESETVEAVLTTARPETVQLRIGGARAAFEVAPAGPEAQTFEGSGQDVRQGVQLDSGLTTVEATHDGESSFVVSLANDSEVGGTFINAIGTFDGAQASLIDGGEYALDIDADGDWTVSIAQPRVATGQSLPQSFEGEGPAVIGPVDISGTVDASSEHDGRLSFIVEIFPQQGSSSEVIFNDVGSFEGETTASFDGVGWINVRADGSWSLDLE